MASAAVAPVSASAAMEINAPEVVSVPSSSANRASVSAYYSSKLDALTQSLGEKSANLRRLEAQVRGAGGARRASINFEKIWGLICALSVDVTMAGERGAATIDLTTLVSLSHPSTFFTARFAQREGTRASRGAWTSTGAWLLHRRSVQGYGWRRHGNV